MKRTNFDSILMSSTYRKRSFILDIFFKRLTFISQNTVSRFFFSFDLNSNNQKTTRTLNFSASQGINDCMHSEYDDDYLKYSATTSNEKIDYHCQKKSAMDKKEYRVFFHNKFFSTSAMCS